MLFSVIEFVTNFIAQTIFLTCENANKLLDTAYNTVFNHQVIEVFQTGEFRNTFAIESCPVSKRIQSIMTYQNKEESWVKTVDFDNYPLRIKMDLDEVVK
jgi:hypothetical protein